MRLILTGLFSVFFLTACLAQPLEWEPTANPHGDILGESGQETRFVRDADLLWFGRAGDFANPGFQSIAAGEPVGWNKRIAPILLEEEGNRYVRVNASSFYEQRFTQPAADQHVTFSYLARGETGFERAGLQSVQWDGTNGQAYTTRASVGTKFTRVFAPIPILPGYTELELRVRGASDREWIDADDALLLDEGLENGGFEVDTEHWVLEGDAALTTDSLVGSQALKLGVGGRAAQFAAAMFDGQEYFLAGIVRAQDEATTLSTREEWLAADGSPQGSPSSYTVAVATSAGRFLVSLGNRENVAASTVAFENAGPGNLLIDDLSRGSTTVFPPAYFPHVDSANPMLKLIAVWPRQIDSGTVEIRNGSDALVDSVPLLLDRGVGTAEWSGDGQAAGEYTARFKLANASGTNVIIDRPFTLHDDLAVADNDAFTTDVVGRGVWLWMLNEQNLTADRASDIIAAAQADGFNLGVIWAWEDQWPAIVEACARREFPFLPANLDVNNALKELPRATGFNRADYIDLVNQKLGVALESPWAFGYYQIDEPFTDLDTQRAAAAHDIAGAIPAWKRPFMIIWHAAASADKWDTIKPIIHMTDIYPWSVDMYNMDQGLATYSAHVNEQVALARERNREYWAWPQVFSTPEYWRSPTPEATRALIGITMAHGGTGYVLFAYYQIGGVEGLRTRELNPLPEADIWREENARIEAATDELLSLSNHTEILTGNSNVLATVADHPDGGSVLFLVSMVTRGDLAATLHFTDSQTELTEITGRDNLIVDGREANFILHPGDWFAWRMPTGSVDGFLSSISTPAMTFDPTKVFDNTYANSPVYDIAINPVGNRIAIAAGWTTLLVDELGQFVSQPGLQNTQRVEFQDNNLLLMADGARGLGVYNLTFSSFVPGFERYTGAGYDIVPAGQNTYWMTMSEWGLRRLTRDSSSGEFTSGPIISTGDQAQSIIGSFTDERLTFLNVDQGIYNATSDGTVTQDIAGQRFWRSDLSPSGNHLAVARNRRGFSIYTLDADGAVLDSRDEHFGFDHAEDVAWLNDHLLAVADSDGDIGFFFVEDNLDITLRHMWLLDPMRPSMIAAIEAHGTDLAIGYRNGRVVVLDLSMLRTGWYLR